MICPKCNRPLPEGATTCPFCSDAAFSKKPDRSKLIIGLMIGGFVAVTAAIILIIVFLLPSLKKMFNDSNKAGTGASDVAGALIEQPEDEKNDTVLPDGDGQTAEKEENTESSPDAALPLSALNPAVFDEWVDPDRPSVTLLIDENGTLTEIEGMGALQGTITVTSENAFTVIGLYPDTPLLYTYSNGTLIREANGTVPAATYVKASEFTAEPADLDRFIGDYAEGNIETGPYYCFTIQSIQENRATIFVNYLGYNFSPFYATDPIEVTLDANGTGTFKWTDSWGNSGNGSFTLIDGETPSVGLTMVVTESAEMNRGSLATNGTKYLNKV